MLSERSSRDTIGGALARERAYVRKIERRFLSLRESGFYISPKDFVLLLDWHERGVPADLVINALEEVFMRTAARSQVRKIQTIFYCRRAVEEAWEERRAALLGPPPVSETRGGEGKGAFQIQEILDHLARAVRETTAAAATVDEPAPAPMKPNADPPPGVPPREPASSADQTATRHAPAASAADSRAAGTAGEAGGAGGLYRSGLVSTAERLRELHQEILTGQRRDLERLEDELVALETRLLELAAASLAPGEMDSLRKETEDALAGFTARMSERARNATVRRALESGIRRKLELPRYSLFTLVR